VFAPFRAAILGVVQGVTEFLPVSSTAHLLIGARVLGFHDPGSVFTEMIQLGSILAIMWLYREKILDVVVGLPGKPQARRFAVVLLAAFLPALVAGAAGSDYVERVLHTSLPVMAVSFVIGGMGMLAVERWAMPPRVGGVDDVTFGQAVGIGLCQVLALVPGVSRSGATIVGGLLVGLDRPTAAEFSFFLAMPTLAAAFVHSVIEVRDQLTLDRAADIAVGFVAAFVASVVVVKPFLGFVRRAGFGPFAWYRIAVGLVLLGGIAAGRF
jgi:undecaprenyl-diphosphatase